MTERQLLRRIGVGISLSAMVFGAVKLDVVVILVGGFLLVVSLI